MYVKLKNFYKQNNQIEIIRQNQIIVTNINIILQITKKMQIKQIVSFIHSFIYIFYKKINKQINSIQLQQKKKNRYQKKIMTIMTSTQQNTNSSNNNNGQPLHTSSQASIIPQIQSNTPLGLQNKQNQQKSIFTTINHQFTSLKDKYQNYQKQKQQKLLTFPQPKVYPTKPHPMTIQQLKKFNFNNLSDQEKNMLEDLSTFTPHREFVKMMTNRYSDMKKKEHFIKEHSSILSTDQFGEFNRAKFDYQNNSRTFGAFCTGSLTVAGFLIGLYVLPSRKSPWKYTLIGLGAGIALSYGFWRMQIFKYHNRMNQQFKSIIKDKYETQKKSQKIKASIA